MKSCHRKCSFKLSTHSTIKCIPTSLHRRILTSHEVLYCVKRSLNKRCLIELFTQAHYLHSSHTNNEFFNFAEELLQIHPYFFSHSIKLRVFQLSAVIVSLNYHQDACVQQSHGAKCLLPLLEVNL